MTSHQRLIRTGLVLLGAATMAVQGFTTPSSLGGSVMKRKHHKGLITATTASSTINRRADILELHQSTLPLDSSGAAAAGAFNNDTTTSSGGLSWEDIHLPKWEETWREQSIQRVVTQELAKEEKLQSQQEQAASTTTSSSTGVTVTSATMNLVKVILGTGVLALPSGLAAASDHPVALLPASILMAVLGIFSGYTFNLYGRLTHETQAKNMGELWEKCKGKESSWVISAGTLSFTFGVALTYSLVIGDFLSSLASSLGSRVPVIFGMRQFWILSVTLSTLLPLCNLKSLAALAPMSILGTFGTVLTTLFMAARCPAILGGSPYAALGKFATAAPAALAPQFNTFSKIASPASLVITAMATTAFLGHFNAGDFYHGFKSSPACTSSTSEQQEQEQSLLASDNDVDETEKKDRQLAFSKYSKTAKLSFAGVTLVNIAIMAFGFLTFGGNCAGVVLNNYSTADRGAVISRLLMTLSVIGGYPFMIGGAKAAIVQLYNDMKGKTGDNDTVSKWATRGLLTTVTALALVLNDAGLVVGLNGALMGSAIIYIFPTLLFLSHSGKQVKAAGGQISAKLKRDRWISRFLLSFGAVSGLLGAAVTVAKAFAPHLLY